MPDVTVELKNEKTITVPVPADSTMSETLGDFIKFAAQDGYVLKMAALVTEEKGNQRDPWTVTKGLRITMTQVGT